MDNDVTDVTGFQRAMQLVVLYFVSRISRHWQIGLWMGGITALPMGYGYWSFLGPWTFEIKHFLLQTPLLRPTRTKPLPFAQHAIRNISRNLLPFSLARIIAIGNLARRE